MNLKVMSKTAAQEWTNHLVDNFRVVAPHSADHHTIFDQVSNAVQVDLDYKNSVLPPKKALLPQHEDLMRFDHQTETVQPVFDSLSTVILGIHTCDLHAIRLLDQVFSTGYLDQHYLARRQNTFLVSIECLEPCTEYAFCKDMGTLSAPEGFDLHMTDLGDCYGFQIGSPKGEELLDGFEGVQDATEIDRRRYYRVVEAKWSRFPYHLEADITELPNLLKNGHKSPIWQELEGRCLGCGACTIVCPTCYCFDVVDEIDLSLSVGKRYRKWDSCQLNKFASVAGGHDFRPGQSKRQQHRFLRKYRYQSAAPGLLGCVGCGRCASACLVDINPADVLNKLYRSQYASSKKQKEVTFR